MSAPTAVATMSKLSGIRRRLFRLPVTLFLLIAVGCGGSDGGGGGTSSARNRGQLMGGQRPICGATVKAYAAGQSAYGKGATLLAGAIRPTDKSGRFSFALISDCQGNPQVYMLRPAVSPITRIATRVAIADLRCSRRSANATSCQRL